MHTQLRLACYCILFTAAISSGNAFAQHAQNITNTHDLKARADSACKQFIEEGKSAGLAIGIIQDGNIYTAAHGYADKESQKPVTVNTIFEIGSITKVFTASLAQILADKGKLDWHADVYDNLPANMQPASNDHTEILHLATHTSGYPRMPLVFLLKMNQCNPYASVAVNEYYDYVKNVSDKPEPDTGKYNYSNTGFSILGNIIEHRSGKSYDALLQTELCNKLDMTHTGFSVKDTTEFATAYDGEGNKTCHWDFTIMYGAGAIRSGIPDMIRFAQANMVENPLYGSLKKTQQKVYDIPHGAIAKGWHINNTTGEKYGLGDIIWHNGGTGGFSSFIGLLPDKKTAVILLANQSTRHLDELAMRILITAGIVSMEG